MLRMMAATIAAFAPLAAAQFQSTVTVDESKIRALLKQDSTVVSLPLLNTTDHPITAVLSLAWVNTKDVPSGATRRAIAIQPGSSTIEVPLPLTSGSVWTRLRYTLAPDQSQARAFQPIAGTLALPQIADHVFQISASCAGVARRGSPFTVHAEAVHPLTRMPITGIEWKASLMVDEKELTPQRVSKHEGGFIDFTFELPATSNDHPDDEAEVEVAAKLGDFEQSVSLSVRSPARLSGRVQSDKTIYQPGQALHLRTVVLNPQGRAAQGAKVTLRIEDQSGERVHTAQLVTSKFGVIQDDWEIPATTSLGTYSIALTAEGDDYYQIAHHAVRVSRYELPAFRVTAKPDRQAYLPSQQPRVTVTGTYLFGKPVPSGRVKVVRGNEPRWNPKTRKSESTDQTVAEGDAAEDGSYTALLDVRGDQESLQKSEGERFEDIHFAAYFKDLKSGRTEQRRFDIRITRDPIHIYVIRSEGGGALAAPVYVSTSYADGRPAATTVDIRFRGRTTSIHTNRYGVGRTELPNYSGDEGGPEVRATDAAGQTGVWRERYWSAGASLFRLETRRTIHRSGESVTLTITAPPEAPPNQFVMIHAIAGERRIASRIARIENRKGEVTFPYRTEFRRTVAFAAWNAVDPRADYRMKALGSKAVIFPDGSDLKVSASAERGTYKPGEKATLRMQVASADGQPVEAALGLAVVDQAVLERARTDSEFGRRPYFACSFCADEGESEIGGVRLNDLYALKPSSAISAELDLVAEALVARAGAPVWSENSESLGDTPSFSSISSQMAQISAALDRHYAASLDFPEDLSTLSTILGPLWSGFSDPWGRSYSAQFTVERENRVITLLSSGPDKQQGTADDFVAGTLRRSYFAPLQHMIAMALKSQEDFPATEDGFAGLLAERGLLLGKLRDPWGTAYRAKVRTAGATRFIGIISAGPDRVFETADDVTLADLPGTYFRKTGAAIAQAIHAAARAPRTVAEFQEILRSAGFVADRIPDAWGRPYRVFSLVSSRYTDRVHSTNVRVFGGPVTTKKETVPVTEKFITFSLRSSGPDGVEDTYDDFDIARFPVILGEESARAAASTPAKPAGLLRGTGAISGIVTDPAGAVVPRAKLTLIDAAQASYESECGGDGAYHFLSVPIGVYSLKAEAPGFRLYTVSKIPVVAGRTTAVDMTLSIGEVAETVRVESAPVLMQTETASISEKGATATPRVREYFPETLLWMPEIVTDPRGGAQTQLTLADAVTTWRIAVFASTLDGRSAEAESELRAFQPFFLDFNPPLVLTEGDRIELPVMVRNYQDRAQAVSVTMQPNQWSVVQGSPSRQLTVPPNNSVDVAYIVQAKSAAEKAPYRITAVAAHDRDAIEKTSRVHPDGQEVVRSFGDLLAASMSYDVAIPPSAIRAATRGELRLYPNVAAMLLESASAILAAPHGCAEQTTSAGYANLVAWRFARASGITDPKVEKFSLANVRLAVEGIGSFQSGDGGIQYWATGHPDAAATAYALSFLIEASAAVPVDRKDLASMTLWLEKKQEEDGRWLPRSGDTRIVDRQALLLTSTVAGALARAQKAGIKVQRSVLGGAYHHIAQFIDQTDEPYMLANFVLAALESGDEALLGDAVARLAALGREERGGLYWDLQTNSPFFGWGTAGRYESTGLVVSALSAWRAKHPSSTELDALIRRGLVFLLRGRNAAGSWYSTQSTVRVMRAFADASSALGGLGGQGGQIEIRANGRVVKLITVTSDPKTVDPILVDLSPFLSPGDNQIALAPSAGTRSALIRLASSWWLPWERTKARSSPALRLAVQFDRSEVRAGEPVRCSVKAERVGFHGYGMMLAEIGLPPGAEVDRASLESVLKDGAAGLDRYEVLPDRVILYLWPRAGGSSFGFLFSLRTPMTAKSAVSILYDYYNPEALSEVIPTRWTVQ